MAIFPSHVSSSGIDTFLHCPIAYRLTYIDKREREPGNIYTSFGCAVHKALETNFAQKIKSKVDLPFKEVKEAYDTEMYKQQKELGRFDASMLEMINLQAEELLYKYMTTVAPTLQPIAAEHKFEIELKSIGVTILGYIDLIAEVIATKRKLIIDYKTTGTSTYQKRTQNYVDQMNQLTMYSLAFRKQFGEIED